MIEEIYDEAGRRLALIVSNRYDKPGVSFFTGGELSQQLGYMHHQAGTIIKAFIDEDVPLAMPVAAQAPMVVGAPAAPMQVQAAPASSTPSAQGQ